jgi:hypothetical protein
MVAATRASGRLRPRLEAGHRSKRGRKRLSGQIERFLRARDPAAKEGKHGRNVPLVEDAERLRRGARGQQQLAVRP